MNRLSHRRTAKPRQRRGAATVEFAISISVVLLFVFASIEFVRLNMLKHSIEHASYLAARRGIITGATVADVQQVAQDHLAIIGISSGTVLVSPNPIEDDTSVVEVRIDVPTLGNTWISPVHFEGVLSGRTRMLAERAAADMSAALESGS